VGSGLGRQDQGGVYYPSNGPNPLLTVNLTTLPLQYRYPVPVLKCHYSFEIKENERRCSLGLSTGLDSVGLMVSAVPATNSSKCCGRSPRLTVTCLERAVRPMPGSGRGRHGTVSVTSVEHPEICHGFGDPSEVASLRMLNCGVADCSGRGLAITPCRPSPVHDTDFPKCCQFQASSQTLRA
jgi:hypothetical protein